MFTVSDTVYLYSGTALAYYNQLSKLNMPHK